MMKTCERCGGEFRVPPSRSTTARFCSTACVRVVVTRTCIVCGDDYCGHPDRIGAKTCSHQCAGVMLGARQIGVTVEEWLLRRASGEKWCTACKSWHPVAEFPRERARGDGRRARCVAADCGKPIRRYPLHEKARSVMATEIRAGRMPRAAELACIDCGHIGDDRVHSYDHHLGYDPDHWLDVEPVCSICHAVREAARRRESEQAEDLERHFRETGRREPVQRDWPVIPLSTEVSA